MERYLSIYENSSEIVDFLHSTGWTNDEVNENSDLLEMFFQEDVNFLEIDGYRVLFTEISGVIVTTCENSFETNLIKAFFGNWKWELMNVQNWDAFKNWKGVKLAYRGSCGYAYTLYRYVA